MKKLLSLFLFLFCLSCEKETPPNWMAEYGDQKEEEIRENELPPLTIIIDTAAVSASDTIKIFL
ncbi:MAG: hypothetical protein LUG51_17305 [Tannerellaceae bacterium]|nr:hypothetical protein [Tannerellaceae bacterium]